MIKNFFLPFEKKISFILIFSIFLISFISKVYFIDKHFSHPDDSGIALRIIDEKTYSYLYHEKKNNFLAKNYPEPIKNIFNYLDEFGIIKETFKLLTIPLNTTAAPFQYIPTYFLLHEKMDLKEILFNGRFFSFVFSILSFLIVLLFFKNINFNLLSYKSLPTIILVSLILNFSQEFFIFSINMTTYSAAVLSSSALLYFLIIKDNYTKKINLIINSCKIAFLSILHYQIIFLFPAYYLTKFLINIKINNWNNLKSNIIESIISLIIVIFLVSPFIKLSWGGVDLWLRGENNEYFFLLNNENNIFDQLIYILKFFLTNFMQIFLSMISMFNYQSNFYFINYVIFIFFIFGIFSLQRDPDLYFLNYFLCLCILIVIFLVIINKQTLAPSRHYLFLLPLITIYVGFGINFIFGYSIKLISYLYYIFIMAVFFLIIINYHTFFLERKDPYDHEKLSQIISEHDISNIFSYGFYPDLRLDNNFKSLEKNLFFSYHHFFLNEYNFKENILINNKIENRIKFLNNQNVLFVSKYIKIDNSHIKKLLRLFNINYKSFNISYKNEIISNVDLEHNQSLNSGKNNFYYYIVEFN